MRGWLASQKEDGDQDEEPGSMPLERGAGRSAGPPAVSSADGRIGRHQWPAPHQPGVLTLRRRSSTPTFCRVSLDLALLNPGTPPRTLLLGFEFERHLSRCIAPFVGDVRRIGSLSHVQQKE